MMVINRIVGEGAKGPSRGSFAFAGPIAALVMACATPASAKNAEGPPVPTPFPTPDFHFADPVRDAQYWRLERDVEQKLAVFREARFAALRAEKPPLPAPGTPAWLHIRDVVE